MRTGFRAPVAALVAAGLMGLLVSAARAEDKPAPVVVNFGVSGLDAASADALAKSLQALESVEKADVSVKGGTVQVKAEKTLQLSDIEAAVAALSTEEKKLELDDDAIALTGTVSVAVGNVGDDAPVVEALKSAPNVDKVEGQGGMYNVTFKGSKGATIGELDAALKAKVTPAEGAEAPSVDDVAWTAPKADGGGKHG